VKRVTFDLPVITENALEPGSPKGHTDGFPVELKQTKEFGSLPIIGKAQRSIYSYMLTMKWNSNKKNSSLPLCTASIVIDIEALIKPSNSCLCRFVKKQ
jgi:hypothetical protein